MSLYLLLKLCNGKIPTEISIIVTDVNITIFIWLCGFKEEYGPIKISPECRAVSYKVNFKVPCLKYFSLFIFFSFPKNLTFLSSHITLMQNKAQNYDTNYSLSAAAQQQWVFIFKVLCSPLKPKISTRL